MLLSLCNGCLFIRPRSVWRSLMIPDTVLMCLLNRPIKRVSDEESAMWIIHDCLCAISWTGRPTITTFITRLQQVFTHGQTQVHTHIHHHSKAFHFLLINFLKQIIWWWEILFTLYFSSKPFTLSLQNFYQPVFYVSPKDAF